MTFFFDHDVADQIAETLRHCGHETVLLRNVLPRTATDLEVFLCACERQYLLVTCNRDDFLHLVSERTHAGLIVLIRRRTRQAEAAHLLRLIEKAGEVGLRGNVNFA